MRSIAVAALAVAGCRSVFVTLRKRKAAAAQEELVASAAE